MIASLDVIKSLFVICPRFVQKLDEAAVQKVFLKSLDNYIKWCSYLCIQPVWSNFEDLSKEKKLLFVSLYFLIWGEAANVRFLPECLCYIFHHMVREMDGMLRQQIAQPAKSCDSNSENGVSFLDQVITPLYDVVAARELAPKPSAGVVLLSLHCFELSWPWRMTSSFFQRPKPRTKYLLTTAGSQRRGKTSFVEHRTFLHLYHSFHRLWIFLVMMFQGLTVIAFNDGKFNSKTLREILSLGPTFAVMKFIESVLDVIMMYGAYSTSRRLAVTRIFLRFVWFSCASVFLSFLYVYMLFWLVVLSGKFSFAYFLQIKPLVKPTRIIVHMTDNLKYSWHDLVSKNNHNALTVATLWAPVIAIYLLDIHVFYTIISAIWGFLIGAKDRLGEDTLEKRKIDAVIFGPFWNEIIRNLREEDYVTNLEMELLLMPKNSGNLPLVQWPLFLLASKIFLAKDMVEGSDSQAELWERISRDDYMKYAVEEGYQALRFILTEILEGEGRMWVERVYADIEGSIANRSIHVDFQLKKLSLVITRVTGLLGILKAEKPDQENGAIQAVQDLYDVVRHDVLSVNMREHYETWNLLSKARSEGRLFTNLKWPRDTELKTQIKRLYLLLTIKDSAANVPKNIEARRRLQFFTNSLFMDLPAPKPVREMLSFSVFTPYYSEIVLYSMNELQKKNEDGISTLFYLQKIYPDEWKNFLDRIGCDENAPDSELINNPDDKLELRIWASYRGQTLARTGKGRSSFLMLAFTDLLALSGLLVSSLEEIVRGMMYYRKALMLQSYLERVASGDAEAAVSINDTNDAKGFDLSPEARALADLKFTYVLTCQIYGKQKEDRKPEAADIALLMQRNEALRVAFIDEVESLKDGKVHREYYSKLVKADINGKDKEIYSVKLPGNPKLGEGKPENQNHAIIFTRGNAIQTIDMNQDNYFEEALKMRNLLEEFHQDHGIRPPTILGVREHVFTGSVSSLASFMSNQETSFVTLGQRVLANPLKVRMHYGHPDVFDRVFHITRGGISKASRVINIRFNSTLRQGNVTHHEYIQVGKGRDVGLNQIAVFEGKVSGGNGEQVLSRDVYRLGQLFDFFRMMSFYFTTVGYYFCTMLTVLTVYIFLYGKAYLALSGVGEQVENRALITKNNALSAALNTQFLFQIGIFTAVPMVLCFILELGFLRAVVNFITMQLQLGSVFFTFSLGTKSHYFGRTILHGGARSAVGLWLYLGFLLPICSIHLDLSGKRQWRTSGIGQIGFFTEVELGLRDKKVGRLVTLLGSVVPLAIIRCSLAYPINENKGQHQAHIRTLSGRIMETLLSLRFFIFQYGVVYKLHIQGSDTSLTVYGFSWIVLAVLIILFKVFTFSQKVSVNFQLLLRFVQGVSFMLALAGIVIAVALTELSIASAWKPVIKRMGLWKSIRSIARLYDAGMGMLIFIPIAFFSWFPFVSTFQTRLMFNQAFSRGLEISLILAGNNPNTGI
ncbi:hypothetical protein POTOM_000094 [Populus tomentosa]|uniref:1,3-beta-glucan synthase n=1 Tax=Populus tomentosa TaxID=118781 RepID=A0A8X8DG45_POPTO|nr:hypothetical protein POTOM_000094 [Populus tomentosa]